LPFVVLFGIALALHSHASLSLNAVFTSCLARSSMLRVNVFPLRVFSVPLPLLLPALASSTSSMLKDGIGGEVLAELDVDSEMAAEEGPADPSRMKFPNTSAMEDDPGFPEIDPLRDEGPLGGAFADRTGLTLPLPDCLCGSDPARATALFPPKPETRAGMAVLTGDRLGDPDADESCDPAPVSSRSFALPFSLAVRTLSGASLVAAVGADGLRYMTYIAMPTRQTRSPAEATPMASPT
jgi:hypothetical protein